MTLTLCLTFLILYPIWNTPTKLRSNSSILLPTLPGTQWQWRVLRTLPCFAGMTQVLGIWLSQFGCGVKHSPPGLGWGCPKGWMGGGHRHMCRKVTFRRFSDVPRIATEKVTAVSNVSRVADSISVFVSFQTRRFVSLQATFLTPFLCKSRILDEIDRIRSRE